MPSHNLYSIAIDNYLNSAEEPDFSVNFFSNIINDVKIALSQSDFQKVFLLLESSRDARQGIVNHRMQLAEGRSLVIRDARHRRLDGTPEESWESYAILGLNYLNAVNHLLKIECPEEDQQQLTGGFQRAKLQLERAGSIFLEKILQSDSSDAMMHCAFLLQELAKMTSAFFSINHLEKAKVRIQLAKDFANLKSDNFAIATLSQHPTIENKIIIELDFPFVTPTSSLIDEYQNRSQRQWYLSQPAWKKRLIDAAIPDLLSGKMIPTQLRQLLPGARNAFSRVIMTKCPESDFKRVFQGYHTGNPGHLLKNNDDNRRATQLTLESLAESIGHRHLHVCTVISPVVVRDDEKNLYAQMKEAVRKNETWHYCNIPVNAFRLSVKNDLQDLEELIDVTNLMKFDDDKKDMIELIKAYLINEIKTREKKPFNENANLNILALYKYFCYLLTEPLNIALITACLSGKDRGAIVSLVSSALALAIDDHRQALLRGGRLGMALFGEVFMQTYMQHLSNIVRSGHLQVLAGSYGATRGCARLKSDSQQSIPNSYPKDLIPWLFGKIASFNKEGPSVELVARMKALRNNDNPYRELVEITVKTEILLESDEYTEDSNESNATYTSSIAHRQSPASFFYSSGLEQSGEMLDNPSNIFENQ